MEKMKRKIQKFMQRRNGMDELGQVGLISAGLLSLFALLTGSGWIQIIAWLAVVYSLYRFFSSNLQERQEENHKFVKAVRMKQFRFEQRKEYKIFKCKGCGRNIRVPRRKGKIEVTCPLCGNKTIHKT